MAVGHEKVDATIRKVSLEMSGYMVRKFEEETRRKKINLTGEFEGSFDSSVMAIQGGYVVKVKFKAYGNVLTRSKVFWTKPANGYALYNWVRKVGVDYFKYVPGYGDLNDDTSYKLSEDKKAERIASAIAFQRVNGSKRREYGKMKARNWKRKPFGTGKAYAGHMIRERLAELVQSQVVEAITTK